MLAYVARRLLLIVPTLIGIVTISFVIIQFVPGGPIDQIQARMAGTALDATAVISGGSGAAGADAGGLLPTGQLDPEQVKQLETLYGFDKPPYVRYFKMLWDFARFDFGTSYFKGQPVLDLIVSKLPVSISLGLWTTLLTYLIAIPLGIRKATRAGTAFDGWTSFVVTLGYAIPGFLFAVLLVVLFAGGTVWSIFPTRGLTSENWAELPFFARIGDYFWHIALPVTAMVIGAFANLTMLTKNSILDEVGKQYVLTARAKGLSERAVLYGHVFRNAMLIVIAGFPAAFVSVLFSSSLLIEVIFSLDGLGLLGFEATINRDYPVMLGSLFFFSLLGLVTNLLGDITYVLVDPRIDFERRELVNRAETNLAAAQLRIGPLAQPRRWLSPLTRRRWASFRAHRRGYVSLWLFVALFGLSLFAELIANDRPILMSYRGQLYLPALVNYPETAFGGAFETEADYRDPAVQSLIARGEGWMLWPAIRFSYRTIDYGLPGTAPSPPSARHWLGTDDQARDVLARLIYGFRLSVSFGLLLTLVSSVVGVCAGAIQGYFGGWTDLLFQRVIEVLHSLPMLYLLIIMSSFLQPGFFTLMGVLLLVSWMALVHVVRAEFLRARNLDYVRAARALGLRNRVIMFRHILPNAIVATLTFLPFILSSAITTLTALDFLGFGLPRGSPSIGELLNQAKNNLHAPWLGIAGFAVMAVMLSLLIFIGEAARDAFDPRKSQ